MKYIQRKCLQSGLLETVDEVETKAEAQTLLREYQFAAQNAEYYISSRACKDWRER